METGHFLILQAPYHGYPTIIFFSIQKADKQNHSYGICFKYYKLSVCNTIIEARGGTGDEISI
jgi:hypothetical protein